MISEAMKDTVTKYEEIVLAMDDPTIIRTALKMAYYTAMLDAALFDPLDDSGDQQDLCDWFQNEINIATDAFQSFVNDKL